MTHSKIEHYGPLVGRSLLALLFILSGIGILTNIPATAGYYASLGIPLATLVAVLILIVKLASSTMLVTGIHAREGAWALVVFTVLATLVAHTGEGQMISALKNLAIVGGLLMVIVHGPGPVSWGEKCMCPLCKKKNGAVGAVGSACNCGHCDACRKAKANTSS